MSNYSEKELIEMSINWFREISQKCDRLTSANVSHNAKIIKGVAIRCEEFLLKEISNKSK